jgi:cell division septation protein DedD
VNSQLAAPPTSTAAAASNSVAAAPEGAFAIQVAALNDPLRAKDIAGELMATGLPAYLVIPPASDPDAPYKVRVGPYATRDAAEKTAGILEKRRGEKLWVMRERGLEITKATEITTKERR